VNTQLGQLDYSQHNGTSIRMIFGHLIERYMPLIIIIIGILIRLPLLFTPLTNGLSDNWRYTDTASIAHNFIHSETGQFNILYPQINWGGNGPGYVETEFQLYPFITAILYSIFGEQVWLGRLVSLVFTVLAFLVFDALVRRTWSSTVAAWALFFFVVSPISIRYSIGFMPEATVLFFYVAALYLFLRWLDEQDSRLLFGAAVMVALAVLVKPTSINIGLIFLLLLLQRYGLAAMKQPRLWLFALVCLLPGALWYWHARNLYLEYGNTFGILSGGDSKLGNFSYWLNPRFYFNLAKLDLVWIFGWGGAPLFLIGLYSMWRNRQPLLPLFGAVTMLLYYMVVARYAQMEWGIQYHVFFLPFAALGVGIGVEWIISHVRKLSFRNSLALFGSALLVICWLSIGVTISTTYRALLRPVGANFLACANAVASIVPSDARIIVSTTSLAFDNGVPNNYQEPQIFFYSNRYGWSLASDQHTPALVEQYRREGAWYFVIYEKQLLDDNPDLARYLESNARQVGPGVQQGCGIYSFNTN